MATAVGSTPSELPQPPGQHSANAAHVSYSDKIKMNLRSSNRLKRKVLEMSIEGEGNIKVEENYVAKLTSRLGIDPKSHMEGFQICPGNSKKILLWFKDSCDITKFCKDESFKINDSVRTGVIRQMDHTEVTVSIRGLNFNTSDTVVMEYLGKHGKVICDKVVYEVASDGPFKGLKNGNRKYKVDFRGGINMGTYHIIDGAKIEIRYPGQRRTCGRCHKISSDCLGGGIGKLCQEKGGEKVKLSDHMAEHWGKIGFKPNEFTLDEETEIDNDIELKEAGNFTPVKMDLTE